jgi:hypothetical protein
VRFADGPFVYRIERWLALVHAHLCGLMTILRLQAANGRTIPLGCPVQQDTQTAQIGSLFRVPLLQLHLS